MSDRAPDFRQSEVGRRQSWHGVKRHVKVFLSLRVPHWVLRRLIVFRPALRRSGRLPAPRHVREVEGRADGISFVMLRPDRCVVAKELYWGSGRRPRAEDDLAIERFAELATEADIVFDVGAYTGIFSLVAAKASPSAQVHAFEIVPAVVRMLEENCRRNGVQDRVRIHHEALGTPGGSITVPEGSGGSALPDFYSTRLHFEVGAEVPVVGLDAFVDEVPTGAGVLMKIDVEGAEDEVLAHGTRFLASFRPDILCELLHGIANVGSVERSLAPLGYRSFLVTDKGLVERSAINPDPKFRDWFFKAEAGDFQDAARG